MQFPVLERRFNHVNVDLAGLLPPSLGFSYLLTKVDCAADRNNNGRLEHSLARRWPSFALHRTSVQTGAGTSPLTCGRLMPAHFDLERPVEHALPPQRSHPPTRPDAPGRPPPASPLRGPSAAGTPAGLLIWPLFGEVVLSSF